MRAYLVGGAVRDTLLGRSVGDRDFVVIGETPENMLAAGFMPVGGEFPVFLHPKTKEEYALARTEKKHGKGYHGFVFYAAPDVSLKDDLRRRDLTVNAIAQDENGKLIDPWGGINDLTAKVLRHVSPAFSEDPVRLLRVARFAATLPDFSIAADTMALMRHMVQRGEAANLTAERVWRELARGLTAACPARMIEVMNDCGLLEVILPEVAALRGVPERRDYHPEGETYIHTLMVLDAAADLHLSAAECFAALVHDIGKAQTPATILPSHHGHEARSRTLVESLCQRLKTPQEFSSLALTAAAEHGNVHNALVLRSSKVVDLLMRLDVFRRPTRAESVLRVCEADYAYWPARRGTRYPQGEFIRLAIEAAKTVDSGAIACTTQKKYGHTPSKIAEQIRYARIRAVRTLSATSKL
ncbi:multifunctional CCA addition/repair protein [Candidatus Persebacteraceae bacterium Df01]|uniref:Multifunctional CCA addition/repair protein n=1 Tax=Candidatus Doriopsillibacter californiensis TaxID=2970740 RepID=A0ABT7QJY0_9GAMM|nr:multifunctional CCA addition/repair protein [Candidatus Persebacteraceae bacterium Df01]